MIAGAEQGNTFQKGIPISVTMEALDLEMSRYFSHLFVYRITAKWSFWHIASIIQPFKLKLLKFLAQGTPNINQTEFLNRFGTTNPSMHTAMV